MFSNLTITNDSFIHIEDLSEYDRNGAIVYTIVVLFFYSFTLFCSLILYIDPNDHYHEKKFSVYQMKEKKRIFNSSQADILNVLSDQTLRQKYWHIYYGNDLPKRYSDKFISEELKRLSIVSERMKKLNNEQRRQSTEHEELHELNRMASRDATNPSPDPSLSSFLFRFRRPRSVSVYEIGNFNPSVHRSYDILCKTPLCTPIPTKKFIKN